MLSALIAQLDQLIGQVKFSGPVADAAARLDISTHAKSGYDYARLRTGSQLKSCGRVGSEKYVEVPATLHRRDTITELTQAISALKRADAIPVVLPELVKALPTAKDGVAPRNAKSVPVAREKKSKGRKQLYTHVKTKQGSVVHAGLGKEKSGEWRTPALCGATPPQRDRLGWEFPTHDDGVTCAKCYRKLPANSNRHFPGFG